MVQLTAVTLTVDVTRMTAGTSRSWGAIWKCSETVTYGCHAICCSRPTWLKPQIHDFTGWHGWRVGWLGPLLTTIVAAVVDWLVRLEIDQKQGKATVSEYLPTGRLSARAPVANEDCGEGGKGVWAGGGGCSPQGRAKWFFFGQNWFSPP